MKLVRYISLAIEGILANKLRSGLTMLGLFIGVVAILMTVSLIRAAKIEVIKMIESQGANTLMITPKIGSAGITPITAGDTNALIDHAEGDNIVAVSPVKSEFVRVVNGSVVIQSQISGITNSYFQVKNLKLAAGSFFRPEDDPQQQRVVILSDIAALGLFKGGSALGQSVRIKNVSFQVIGVLKASGDSTDSQLRPIYLPMQTAQTYLLQDNRYRGDFIYDQVIIQVADRQSLNPAEQNITQTLRARRNLEAGTANDFDIFNQEQILQMVDMMSILLGALVGGMGAVSVVVGGVGIMNIMLVSVTERTSEIGLRKALGAHDSDICLQFLIEAMLLCLVGSLLGIAISYASCSGINALVGYVRAHYYADLTFQVSIGMDTLILSLAVGSLSGFVFGLYPALRATRLDPIEALRYE
ncbi:MAG: ABC transporter permease [Caldilineaceae bacterium]